MILDTAEKMFKYFLTEVRKEFTVVITPDQWNEFVNPVFIDWIKTKLPLAEFVQKRIDDLEAIKVLTDGRQYQRIPSYFESGNIFQIPYTSEHWPAYMHGISAQFAQAVASDGSEPDDGTGETAVAVENDDLITTVPKVTNLIGGKIFRSDTRAVNSNNPYRQPIKGEYAYFDNRGGFIYVQSEELSYDRMILEYYRYPEEVLFIPNGDSSAGSFMPTQNKEIIDMAVTRYLEKVSDQRLQTQPQVEAQVPK